MWVIDSLSSVSRRRRQRGTSGPWLSHDHHFEIHCDPTVHSLSQAFALPCPWGETRRSRVMSGYAISNEPPASATSARGGWAVTFCFSAFAYSRLGLMRIYLRALDTSIPCTFNIVIYPTWWWKDPFLCRKLKRVQLGFRAAIARIQPGAITASIPWNPIPEERLNESFQIF